MKKERSTSQRAKSKPVPAEERTMFDDMQDYFDNMNFLQETVARRTFIDESNRIEGIIRRATLKEEAEYDRFMKLDKLTILEVEKFVSVYQPGAVLRNRKGLDVRVGNYFPPSGGIGIETELGILLGDINDAYDPDSELRQMWDSPFLAHKAYESLHPFTDGNGRSGRMIWRWHMNKLGRHPVGGGFLHSWYYSSLAGK